LNEENTNGLIFPARPSLGRNVLWIASIALIYSVAAQLSLLLEFQPEGIAAIWPPTGIFLSAVLLTRRGLRPWLVGILLLTDFVAEVLAGTPFLVSAIYSLSLAGDAVLSAWLLIRFVGEPLTFRRVRDLVGWLALSVLFSNALTSLVAAGASELLPGTHSFWSSWQWWATPDGVGNLLVTPFILSWAAWARTRLRTWNRRRAFEWAALSVSVRTQTVRAVSALRDPAVPVVGGVAFRDTRRGHGLGRRGGDRRAVCGGGPHPEFLTRTRRAGRCDCPAAVPGRHRDSSAVSGGDNH
jgi:hypothetical protein